MVCGRYRSITKLKPSLNIVQSVMGIRFHQRQSPFSIHEIFSTPVISRPTVIREQRVRFLSEHFLNPQANILESNKIR